MAQGDQGPYTDNLSDSNNSRGCYCCVLKNARKAGRARNAGKGMKREMLERRERM